MADSVVNHLRGLGVVDQNDIIVLQCLLAAEHDRAQRLSVIHNKEAFVTSLFVRSILAVHQRQTLAFLLRAFADLCQCFSELAAHLAQMQEKTSSTPHEIFPADPAVYFLDLWRLHPGDADIRHAALYLTAVIIRHSNKDQPLSAARQVAAGTFIRCVQESLVATSANWLARQSGRKRVMNTMDATTTADEEKVDEAAPNRPVQIDFVVYALSVFVRRRDQREAVMEAGLIQKLLAVVTEALQFHVPLREEPEAVPSNRPHFVAPPREAPEEGHATTSLLAGMTNYAAVKQLLYDTLLTLWILSFNYRCLAALHNAKAIPTLHRVLQRTDKEKIIRMSLLLFHNFFEAQKLYYHAHQGSDVANPNIFKLAEGTERGPNFFAEAIGSGMTKTLWQLTRRKFGDEDITELVEAMTEMLDANAEVVSSWSEYECEIQSGVLEWTPIHSSPKFWKENVRKFELNGFALMKELHALLKNESSSELTMAVACHDIGEVVRYHTNGRLMLATPALAGLKNDLLQLTMHPSPPVARQALTAIQKVMIKNWDFIQ